MALGHSPSIATSGLILYLDAANIKSYPGSGTAWTDLSGNSNNGTTNASFDATGAGSFAFNGSQRMLANSTNIPALNFGTGSFAVNFWIYPTNWGEGRSDGIVGQKANDGTTGWVIYNDGFGPDLINARLTYDINFYSSSVVVNNTWQNWTLVRNVANSTLSWYLNGTLDKIESRSTNNLNDTSSTFYIGFSQTWSGYFIGNLSNMQIYNRALSAAEVTQNFNALRGRYGI